MSFRRAARKHAPPVARPRRVAAVALACAPAAALAHGQQILLMPVGNPVALAAVVAMALGTKASWAARLTTVLLALAVAVPPYFSTNEHLPWWVTSSEVGCFLLGLIPPLVAAALVLGWSRSAAARG